jgi:hypothetical protein
MESYIVRVYRRRTENGAQGITRLVEAPARNERRVFHSFAELESILRSDARLYRSRTSARRK